MIRLRRMERGDLAMCMEEKGEGGDGGKYLTPEMTLTLREELSTANESAFCCSFFSHRYFVDASFTITGYSSSLGFLT